VTPNSFLNTGRNGVVHVRRARIGCDTERPDEKGKLIRAEQEPKGIEFMKPILANSTDAIRWSGRLAVLMVAVTPAGCSPEGTGTIKVGDPQSVREKLESNSATKKPATEKQAKAVEAEAEAAKKHPKLR